MQIIAFTVHTGRIVQVQPQAVLIFLPVLLIFHHMGDEVHGGGPPLELLGRIAAAVRHGDLLAVVRNNACGETHGNIHEQRRKIKVKILAHRVADGLGLPFHQDGLRLWQAQALFHPAVQSVLPETVVTGDPI